MIQLEEGLSRAIRDVLAADPRPILLEDKASGNRVALDAAAAAAPDGLLPALLAVGEAEWRAATGHGFGLRLAEDAASCLGFKVVGIDRNSLAVAFLTTTQVIADFRGQDAIVVNDLNLAWQRRVEIAPPVPARSASPSP